MEQHMRTYPEIGIITLFLESMHFRKTTLLGTLVRQLLI